MLVSTTVSHVVRVRINLPPAHMLALLGVKFNLSEEDIHSCRSCASSRSLTLKDRKLLLRLS